MTGGKGIIWRQIKNVLGSNKHSVSGKDETGMVDGEK
jgi:hypothetical protein